MNNDSDLYIVPFEYLPEALQKTAKLNQFLIDNPNITIRKGCELYGLSKSTYYKYNNKIVKYKK